MKKIIALSIFLLSLQLSAQDIQLTILQNSVKVKNDSLYFKYEIRNNSDTIFVLYNVRIFDFANEEEEYYKYAPRLGTFIYNERGELKSPQWEELLSYKDPRTPIIKSYEDSIHSFSFGKYILLNPGKAIKYDSRLSVESLELEQGVYTFQLRYFSSDHYKSLYLKAKKKDVQLKNSLMFEGVIRSNTCLFKFKKQIKR